MSTTFRTGAGRFLAFGFMLLVALPAGAQEEDGFDGPGDRDRPVPTAARRAHEWHGTSDPSHGAAWHLSAGAGFAIFSGDDAVEEDAGFAAEFTLARDMTEDLYVIGSYLVAGAGTEADEPGGGTDQDDHLLHITTVGVGFHVDTSSSVALFIEPKIGAVFGDADAGPVGGATAGVLFEIQPGLLLRVNFTGLLTDSSFDTSAGDADLDAIFSVGVGVVFTF